MWTESEIAFELGKLNQQGTPAVRFARNLVDVFAEKLDNGQVAVTLSDESDGRVHPTFIVSITAANISSAATKISNEISKFVL